MANALHLLQSYLLHILLVVTVDHVAAQGDSRAAKRSRVKSGPRRTGRKSQGITCVAVTGCWLGQHCSQGLSQAFRANADETKIEHISYKNAGALRELGKIYHKYGAGTFVQVSLAASLAEQCLDHGSKLAYS